MWVSETSRARRVWGQVTSTFVEGLVTLVDRLVTCVHELVTLVERLVTLVEGRVTLARAGPGGHRALHLRGGEQHRWPLFDQRFIAGRCLTSEDAHVIDALLRVEG